MVSAVLLGDVIYYLLGEVLPLFTLFVFHFINFKSYAKTEKQEDKIPVTKTNIEVEDLDE